MTSEDILNGLVIAVDKPRQWSSFQVVNKLKWHIRRTYDLKKFKIGHAGTLDPLASGLLLVCVGKATKRIDELQQGTKVYSGTMVLGATTSCYDLERPVDRLYPFLHVTREQIEQTIVDQFVGEIDQVPPLFSAVKVGGERAYASAREGEAVEIAAKRVTVYQFEVTDYRPATVTREEDVILPPTPTESQRQTELYREPQGVVPEGLPQLDFRITCGKGTYIRSLARDLGEALGSGAFLSALRRERVGEFVVENAIDITAEPLDPTPKCDE